ncbi:MULTISPECIES: M15 family metallopeptidase [Bacillaceae]|uniref:M15 family metallopeptidase n=1 Tax=Bacillaceae TaxID=186817 RepID=UPI0020571624|nr:MULTISPECIES: M15 family metallopeptidase [Bacillaceae]UOE57501.1 M15 family metallopeptidase [Cytobacillus oceanisediminis]
MLFRQLRRFLVFLLLISTIGLLFYQYIRFIEEPDFTEVPPPTALHPVVAEKKEELIAQAADKGINVVITQDFRSIEEQNALYEKGRSAEGNIVTHAKGGESYHNFGLAIDFALMSVEGQVIWDMQYDGNGNSKADWMEVVEMAKDLGFEWGGDWAQFKDYPHLQMDFGLTIWELQRGKWPPETE